MYIRRLFAIGVLLGALLQVQAADVKNVIWVIGDGMGPEILGFWMQGVRYGQLQDYPTHVSHTEELMNQSVWGMFFTNTYDTVVSDSAAAATQMATGQLARPSFIGVDYNQQPVETILEIAQKRGKAIGVISDAYVTDATPAGFTAHTTSRKDRYNIARQQIELGPQVLLGGGLKYFNKKENKDLLRQAAQNGYQIVQDKKQLSRVKKGKVLGLFAKEAMPMAVEQYQHPQSPTLMQMTQKALDLLQQNQNGFVLMVEAGKIDWAAHANDPGSVLAEMKAFDQLIALLHTYAQQHPDTLLYVNADHDTGLGGFVYRELDDQQVADKTAHGEVIYGGRKDYASFKTYALFEKQKRNLYYVYNELQALPKEKRTAAVIEKHLTQALGYPVDMKQFKDLDDLQGIFKQLNEQRGLSYATMNHSASPLVSIAYGAGADKFAGIYHNTDILARLTQLLGWQ